MRQHWGFRCVETQLTLWDSAPVILRRRLRTRQAESISCRSGALVESTNRMPLSPRLCETRFNRTYIITSALRFAQRSGYRRYGRGAGVGRARGVGVARTPGGSVAVGDAVTVAVAVGDAVAVPVAVGVAVGV